MCQTVTEYHQLKPSILIKYGKFVEPYNYFTLLNIYYNDTGISFEFAEIPVIFWYAGNFIILFNGYMYYVRIIKYLLLDNFRSASKAFDHSSNIYCIVMSTLFFYYFYQNFMRNRQLWLSSYLYDSKNSRCKDAKTPKDINFLYTSQLC